MNYEVLLTDKAIESSAKISDWIQERSPKGAQSWMQAFDKAVSRLRRFADSCGLAPEGEEFNEPVYESFFQTRSGSKYRLLLLRRGGNMLVVDVRGPGQDLLDPRTTRLPPQS